MNPSNYAVFETALNVEPWRNGLFTFADEHNRLFSVTNCPPIIHPIATTADGDFLANRSVGSLLRPQWSTNKFPELPFLLHKLPVADPLLSRLCVDPSAMTATQYEGGWALKDDVRKIWIALEKGLLHISDLLFMFPEEASVPSSAAYAIRAHEHWPPPQDYGYRQLHTSASAAELSIRRAHGAFQVLAARCSLAIALWTFPGPVHGSVPNVWTSRYDSATATIVPDWVHFLRVREVPSSWIDAICDSVVSDFSINLRVGTVFDPSDCTWLPIAPVLMAANVPVFVLWRNPIAINECQTTYPFMAAFVPSIADAREARMNLPGGQPRVVTLCRDGITRLVPDYSAVDDTTPPFGPYQLPGETRKQFFERRELYRADQLRQESILQKERRRVREAHAKTGAPPYRRSRLYLWVKPELIFPNLNPRWADHEYRFPIPPPAYRSLWTIHPDSHRQYNAFFDEWDLWFPAGWSSQRGEDTTPQQNLEPTLAHDAERHSAALEDESDLLNPAPEDREIETVDLADNFMLHSWYGIQLQNTRVFSGVDYESWWHDIWHLFGETRERFTTDEGTQKCLAGWVSAVMKKDWTSHALEFTWDLDRRHTKYILGPENPDPRLSVSLYRIRSPERKDDPENNQLWVMVKPNEDPEGQAWSLITTPGGAMLIVRRLAELKTSAEALHALLCAGIPARTGVWFKKRPSRALLPKPPPALKRLGAPWRMKGEKPTIQDYDAYCQRVLQLCQSPHARAAWLKGGIVWRIMVEVTGKHPQADICVTHLEELQSGPSGMKDHYEAVALKSKSRGFYDDGLSPAELDIISGVVRVYTGRGSQTEDASWWPKHGAWLKGSGYTGIWSPSDERWFQRRLKAIHAGEEGPMNASAWKQKLKRQKKAGALWDVIEQQEWDFIFRHFSQCQESHLPPEMRPRPKRTDEEKASEDAEDDETSEDEEDGEGSEDEEDGEGSADA